MPAWAVTAAKTPCVCASLSYLPKLCSSAAQKALPLILQSKPLIVFWNSLHKWLPDDWQGLWVGVTPLPGKTRVSFQVNFAGFSQKCLFNTTVTSNVQWLHRGHVGPLALSVVSPGSGWLKDAKRALLVVLQKDARREQRTQWPATDTLSVWLLEVDDMHLSKVRSIKAFELLD